MYAAKSWFSLVTAIVLVPMAGVVAAQMGTAFTYQGELELDGQLVSTACDFEFTLWDDPGSQIGPTLPITEELIGGRFTVELDFGAGAVTGEARWLEIKVRCPAWDGLGGEPPFSTLTPRQKLTPAPHALALPGLWTEQNDTSPNLLGGYGGNEVAANVIGATIAGGGVNLAVNHVADDFGAIGGGLGNQAGSDDGDTANATGATVAGGSSNTASAAMANVGGGSANQATGAYATVGGGQGNFGSQPYATVGGGESNEARGSHAVISGGYDNYAPYDYATIGGGSDNQAEHAYATIAGGEGNRASGGYSTIPGGQDNTAAGTYSFAAGRRAKVTAAFDGTFVWADSTDADFASTGNDQFLIRAAGGVGIGTPSPAEQLDVAGNIHASGTITSGSSITMDGATDTITTAGGKISFDDEDLVTTGNIGIGTTMPTEKLEIAGTPGVDGIKFPDGSVQTTSNPVWTKSGDDIFYTAGNVGIGAMGSFAPIGDTLITESDVLPTARCALACAGSSATGTWKIYCFGGVDGGQVAEIIEYDPDARQITPKTAVLPSARSELACVTYPTTGKIYCFGGWDGTRLNEIIEYDPVSDTLATKLATLPSPRNALSCAASSATDTIYCLGGHDGNNPLDEIVEYDPSIPDVAAPIPIKDAVLPSGRYGLACATDPTMGKIYCFGGNDDDYLDQITEYDPVSDTLATQFATLPSPRDYLACAADSTAREIYCFGGRYDGSYLGEIVEYNPETDALVPRPVSLSPGRSALACATYPPTGKIYCFGGMHPGYLNEIVEYYPPAQVLLQVGDPSDGTLAIANTWSVFSSREFKRDIAPLNRDDYQEVLGKLKATDAVRYRYANDERRTVHLGVIAEDSPAEILSPGGKAVSLADYTTFLMAAIKAQQVQIEEKDRQIADVQARMADLEARVDQLSHSDAGGVR